MRKSDDCHNSWKSDNFMGSTIEEKNLNIIPIKNEAKNLRGITLWGAIENQKLFLILEAPIIFS